MVLAQKLRWGMDWVSEFGVFKVQCLNVWFERKIENITYLKVNNLLIY